MDLLYKIGIIIFAIAGFVLSMYITKTKNKGNHLACPLGHNCDSVIHSKFSSFLGIRNENIGISYYLLIALFYLMTFFVKIPQDIVFYVLLITSLAFIFNLHLLFVQLIVLKKWCTTCLGSSAFSFLIIVMSFLGFQASFGDYLFGIHDILQWVFLFMVVVGVVTTTLYAKTFIVFLRDFEISKKEAKRLSMFSHTGWLAITLAIMSGLGIILTDIYGDFTESSKFMLILMVLGILILYEIIVNLFIVPKLVDIHFGDYREIEDHHHSFLRKTAFAFMSTGVVSWYILLLLSIFSFYQYTTLGLIIAYIILLIIAVIIASYAEHLYYKRSVLVYETLEEVEIEE